MAIRSTRAFTFVSIQRQFHYAGFKEVRTQLYLQYILDRKGVFTLP